MRHNIFSTIMLLVAAVQFSGCSLIFLANAVTGSSKSAPKAVPYEQIAGVNSGTRCTVTLRNNERISGEFLRMECFSGAAYAKRYNNFRERDSQLAMLPAPGDPIVVKLISDGQVAGSLLAYDHSQLVVLSAGTGRTRLLKWRQVSAIVDRTGISIAPRVIVHLISNGEMPMMSIIVIRNEKGLNRIPLDELNALQLEAKKTRGKWAAVFVGVVVDALLIYSLSTIGGNPWR